MDLTGRYPRLFQFSENILHVAELRRIDACSKSVAGARERLTSFEPGKFAGTWGGGLLIDRPQCPAGTICISGNETTPISARTNVSEASASTPRLRVQGYCLS